jgi:hypothetical protein
VHCAILTSPSLDCCGEWDKGRKDSAHLPLVKEENDAVTYTIFPQMEVVTISTNFDTKEHFIISWRF